MSVGSVGNPSVKAPTSFNTENFTPDDLMTAPTGTRSSFVRELSEVEPVHLRIPCGRLSGACLHILLLVPLSELHPFQLLWEKPHLYHLAGSRFQQCVRHPVQSGRAGVSVFCPASLQDTMINFQGPLFPSPLADKIWVIAAAGLPSSGSGLACIAARSPLGRLGGFVVLTYGLGARDAADLAVTWRRLELS